MYFCFLLFNFSSSGDPVLRSAMAVEELGGREDPRSHDGPRHWRRSGS